MECLIYIKCFFVGMLASASLGPIFILTFNRGALYGFLHGFATGLGACIADAVYFFLGLIGVLSLLQSSSRFMFWLDTLGGLLLIIFGAYFIYKSFNKVKTVYLEGNLGVFLTLGKSFVLTIVNPLVLIFFMLIAVQILPNGVVDLTVRQVLLASIMVALGSLLVLSLVSFIASSLGRCISQKRLKVVSFVTGTVFILVGLFFLDHIFLGLLHNKFQFITITRHLNI